mgnify:CR=1 FL=1
MRLSLLIFVIGVLFVTAGYTLSLSPKCEKIDSKKDDMNYENDNNFKDSSYKIIHNF